MSNVNHLQSFHNGTSFKAYDFFGCHRENNTKGFTFRVWAPHAKSVSVVGSFNGWSQNADKMFRLEDGQSFEAFVSNAQVGDQYKFCIETRDGKILYKADPFAFQSDLPLTTNSVICEEILSENYIRDNNFNSKPINIYEVNLLSWKRNKDGSYYSYKQLAEELVDYVKEMGYTHIEFMPITEYPFDGSWGYQVTGYFSVVSRLGTPQDFKNLVNAFHQNGIKVILDWVPAHFPKDEFGLYQFDGDKLYECPLWGRTEFEVWGTMKFDYGKKEVCSFLISSASYFLDKFAIDGIRVDAVASMLYLDYEKKAGEWIPNVFGDNRNLEAIYFLQNFNQIIKQNYIGAITIAEESTAFEGITRSVNKGGIGFDFKWNMGWMHDILHYCKLDPILRAQNHNKLNFSMTYAFSENFVLPLSHDEVVHLKGSIINKMHGNYKEKFAGERALLAFMYAHPGKKLNFMGYEVAQFDEWNYFKDIQFSLKEYEMHAKMSDFVKTLNHLYKNSPEIYEIDDSWDGFKWLVVDDAINNVVAFNRYSKDKSCLTVVINFSGIDLKDYRIGIDEGSYSLILNTDDIIFGGEGKKLRKTYNTENKSRGKEGSILVDIPKLTCLYLKKD